MQIGKAQSCAEVELARQMFRAVLAPWAGELMALRRRGLDRPGRRYAKGLVLRPAPAARIQEPTQSLGQSRQAA